MRRNEQGNSPYGYDFLDMSTEDQQLAAYILQAKVYLISNINLVMNRYAKSIYEDLCKQNPDIKKHFYGEVNRFYGERHAKYIIKGCTQLCGELLVLCTPSEREPCVVIDPYIFTDFNIQAFEERMLIEYAHRNKNKFPDTQLASRTSKYAVGHGMDKMGKSLVNKGERLVSLGKYYSSGHSSTMRIQRSIRGKKPQQEALMSMFKKSAKYNKSAATFLKVGSKLASTGSSFKFSSLKPISIWDVFRPMLMGECRTPDQIEVRRMEEIIILELAIYCRNKNNYQYIINQKYIEQH